MKAFVNCYLKDYGSNSALLSLARTNQEKRAEIKAEDSYEGGEEQKLDLRVCLHLCYVTGDLKAPEGIHPGSSAIWMFTFFAAALLCVLMVLRVG